MTGGRKRWSPGLPGPAGPGFCGETRKLARDPWVLICQEDPGHEGDHRDEDETWERAAGERL